jgi:hypothetical protein
MIKEQETIEVSEQVKAVGNWWLKVQEAAKTHQSLADARDFNEGWQALTTEPGEVDYTETIAGGVPAMWATPKKCKHRKGVTLFSWRWFFQRIYVHAQKTVRAFCKKYGLSGIAIKLPPVAGIFSSGTGE